MLTPSAGSFTPLTIWASSTVLPKLGSGPALLSAAVGEGKSQLPCLLQVVSAKGREGDLSLTDATAQ